MSMQTPVIPSKFEFKITEFLYRDTVAATGRKRFSRVSIHVDRTEDKKPHIRIYVNTVTDYQIARYKDGRGFAYASLEGQDPNGWAYDERSYQQMLGKVGEWHRPTRVMVERLTARARNLMLSYCKEVV